MKYDLKDKYRINVSGTSSEIKSLIRELSIELDMGSSYNQLKNELNNLEHIIKPEQYTFGLYHRIYYNHNSLSYIPNVSSIEAQKFYYNIFKIIFDKSITNLNNTKQNSTKAL
jgi:hypothetical protein